MLFGHTSILSSSSYVLPFVFAAVIVVFAAVIVVFAAVIVVFAGVVVEVTAAVVVALVNAVFG